MNNSFEISYKHQTVPTEVVRTGGRTLYVARIPGLTPLVVHRAKTFDGPLFWTSIPEGRQQEAEEIGKLIDGYLKTVKD
jgi:hypothetical protein